MAHIRLVQSASVTPTKLGVILGSDLGTFQLHGEDVRLFVQEVLPLLNGTRDQEAIADALPSFSRKSVFDLLKVLEERKLIETISVDPSRSHNEGWDSEIGFFKKWSSQPEGQMNKLTTARVLVVGLEPWGVVVASELAAAGVGALHVLDDSDVLQDDLLSVRMWSKQHLGQPRTKALKQVIAEKAPWCLVTCGQLLLTTEKQLAVDDLNWTLIVGALTADDLLLHQGLARFAHRAGVTNLSGYLNGLDAFVGPVVVPGQTACWNCYRLRHLANSAHGEAAHALQASLLQERSKRRERTYLAPMAPTLGHLLGLEALKLISQYTPSNLVGRLMVQNLVTLESSFHAVIRMPWCDVCVIADKTNDPPGGPAPTGIKRLDDVGSSEELREMLAGWVDDRTGVIRYLAVGTPDSTEPELPISCSAVLASYTEGYYHPEEPQIGSGKGLSVIEAMLGATGEAIERYSASRYHRSQLHRSSLRDLQGDFFDPRWLCLYDETQYDEPNFPFAPFDANRPIDWVKGNWLDNHESVWLPALPCYFNFHVHPEERFCQVTSNGLAAGATVDDASLRAVFELVERDAFMLTWLCQRPPKKLLYDGCLEPGIHELVRQFRERGVEIETYLLDVGVSIPTVACLSIGDGKNWPAVTVALAAHMNIRTATRKAILEQGHVAPYVRRLMLDQKHQVPDRPEEVRSLLDHALYYVSSERAGLFDFLRFSHGSSILLSEVKEAQNVCIRSCTESLAESGLRVAIADVTSPDTASSPFRVVRALGTYMQQIDFGFQFRRLKNPRLKAMLTDLPNPNPHPVA